MNGFYLLHLYCFGELNTERWNPALDKRFVLLLLGDNPVLQMYQQSGRAELDRRYNPQPTAMDQLLHQVSRGGGSFSFSTTQDTVHLQFRGVTLMA